MKDYVAENQKILNEWLLYYEGFGFTEEDFAPDGIMYRGEYKYKENKGADNSHWYRLPNGEESKMWKNSPLRVLYLTKDQPSEECGAWDVREECYHHPDSEINEYVLRSRYAFMRNLVYSLYGYYISTKDCFPDLETIKKQLIKEAVRCSDEFPFARINCKKLIGGSSCPEEKLAAAIENDDKFLNKQINSLEADLIVCCGSRYGRNQILDLLGNIGYNLEWINDSIHYDAKRKVVAIDAYHLSWWQHGDTKHYQELVGSWQTFLKNHSTFFEDIKRKHESQC